MTYTPQMVCGQVLWKNVLRYDGVTVTYDGTVVSGFPAVNAYDWRDFSLFQPEASAHLTVESASALGADTICVWWQSNGTDTVALESWSGSAWVAVDTAEQADGQMVWLDIPAASPLKWRLTFSGSNKIRQITLGTKLTFPIGQWNGVNPSSLYQGVVIQNVISMNGSIIGRNLRRIEKSGKIELTLLLPDWVRASWDPFSQHAATKAFFYRWDPVGHAAEVAFAVADSIEAPTNDSPPPRMKVSMPLKFIS